MRTLNQSWLALAAVLVFLGGCAPVQMPEPIAKNLTALKSELASGRASVVQTTTALRNLRDNRGDDIAPQFVTFTAALASLEVQVSGVRAVGESANEGAKTHFEMWEGQIAQIGDDRVAAASKERRAEVVAAYDKLKDKFAALRSAYRPYYASLVDVRTSLSSDLTGQGAKTTRPAMDKAIALEPELLKQIDEVNKALEELTR